MILGHEAAVKVIRKMLAVVVVSRRLDWGWRTCMDPSPRMSDPRENDQAVMFLVT